MTDMRGTPPSAVVNVDGHMALCGVVGSTAYGLQHSGSDQDRLGVYVTHGINLLGLHVADAVATTVTGHDPDVTVHELGKFAGLALKANPTVTELLWLDEYEHIDDNGRELVAVRDAFLSRDTVTNAYLGYARSQIERARRRAATGRAGLDSGGSRRVAKAARHALRLVLAAETLHRTGTLNVHVGDRRDEITDAGQLAVDNLDAYLTLMGDRIDHAARIPSVLPEQPRRDAIDAAVNRIRVRSLDLEASARDTH